ncbi:SDR family NAD(P)-dependent oxidoreductase [Streptomyces sp. DSM 44915]|uniref:SDR family NAD(P)-dependent oxidoreductase n=1 Tax=Streptomyces chisholmiae TaxID=3075540 RepID=A0ABU2JLC8_9ACTN|nr:SDR family NAD(P)-dependent oxidoreductase [Streptomyces sp. DSM 44915]MDT0265784.1 SDR family NAD(P)-dependent oxidoreductase [Streptomyces sp. DSM 44915]
MRESGVLDTNTVVVIGAAPATPARADHDPGALAELTGRPLPEERAAALAAAWTACEDAGLAADDPTAIGVYLAADPADPAATPEPGAATADSPAASGPAPDRTGAPTGPAGQPTSPTAELAAPPAAAPPAGPPAAPAQPPAQAATLVHPPVTEPAPPGQPAAPVDALAAALGLRGPRLTGRQPLAAALAALRSGACDRALVGAGGAFVVLARADLARTDTFGYRLTADADWPAEVPALVEAAVRAGRPGPGRAAPAGPPVPVTVSAHSPDALRARAAELAALLAGEPTLPLADLAHTLATTRPALAHRAVLVGAERDRLADELAALGAGRPVPGLATGGPALPAAGGLAFVFPGHGPQWLGMAAELLDAEPVFTEQLHACAAALAPHVDWPVLDVLRGTVDAPSLDRPEVGQPALWAMMVALSALWRSWGVRPDAVIGSSVGEIPAATVAGALSVEDGARAVARFSRAQVALLERGVMLSVLASADEVRARLVRYPDLDLAAVHAPGSVLVSGTEEAATALLAELAADGVKARGIAIRLAAHGRQVDAVLDALRADLAGIAPRPTDVPLYLATAGGLVEPATLTVDHWCRNLRGTAEFERATRAALAAGHRLLLEPSPHPVLTRAVQETAEDAGVPAVAVGTLRRDRGGLDQVTAALAELHAHGVRPDWPAVFAGRDVRQVPLPGYPLGAAPAGPASSPADELADRLAAAPDRAGVLLDLVRAQVAAVVRGDLAATADPDAPLLELGVDSAGAMALRNLLNAATGLRLPVSAVFDNPTCRGLAAHLDRVLRGAPAEADEPVVHQVAGDDEPIAVVAMSCRLPGGVASPEDLWELLSAGGDGVTAFPTDRGWRLDGRYDEDAERPGGYYQREAGFLADVPRFDPEFFGVSPREALAMDPQQRLLLEVAWEAVERAGIDAGELRGSQAGVFLGAMTMDYGPRLHEAPADLEGYLLTGNTGSVASGRLSYTFGLAGPAVTVDTACSSSLVALHLAVQSLRRGECPLALTGGVTVMSSPGMFVEFSRQRALAPDGRCKAFSASADGFGLAEGASMVLLERLSDARRNGHPVLALIRGTAINQDGASNGLTAPSGPAQRRVIRQALANAGVSATEVDAVEAHGTGTRLGDPIEADALLATYGQGRDEGRPLWLGSVKSNIGHTQAASGVAGLIKMVLALRHGTLPRSLHITEPTPHVDWSAGAVSLVTEATPWPATGRPRRAGVSSFGISGTNAHAVLEQAPDEPPTELPEGIPGETADGIPVETSALAARPAPLVLTARSATALAAHAAQLAPFAQRLAPADLASTLLSRAEFEHRAVVVAGGADALTALAGGTESARVAVGVARPTGRVAFVFPGQGSQWLGMGTALAAASPAFRASLDACAEALAPHVDWSLWEVLADAAALERVDVVQPALFAVMVSLAALWRAHGVEPDAVVGHSQGEIAAAHVAGALTLDDAARVVALRSRAILALSGRGGMVSLALPADRARELLAAWDGRISVAAVNGPGSVVVAGDADALDQLMAHCAADEIRARRVPVDYASHSPHVEAIQDELRAALAGVEPAPASVPMLSTVTGEWLTGPELDAAYWYRNLRDTVRFEEATLGLLDRGVGAFVECSPHPVLGLGVRETLEATGGDAVVVGTLRRSDGDLDRFLLSAAEAYVAGLPFDWRSVVPAGRHVEVPTYPFQRRRFWIEDTAGPATEAEDPAQAAFWSAVERGDLASTLDVPADAPLTDVLPSLADWRRRHRDRATADGWRHRISWRPLPAATTPTLTGTWLLVSSPATAGHPWHAAAVEALRAHGADVLTSDGTPGTLPTPDRPLGGVLSLLALDETPDPAAPAVPAGLAATLALIRTLGAAGVAAPLWLATTGAVATGRSDPPTHPTQAQTWGLGLALGLEHPDRWGGLVDLPESPDARAAARLAAVLAGRDDEDQLAIRASGVAARRLVPAPAPAPAPAWRATGTALITGGTGAIGGHVARWLAGNGAEHLVLASRGGPDAPGADALAAELTALGARVTLAACDAADPAALTALFDRLDGAGTPVRSVFHAAGTVPSRPLADTTTADLAYALAAKAGGAAHLHALTAGRDLDAFVLFSSGSAVWGSGELGAYGAANAYLDALAGQRRAAGLPATSVSWGMWAGDGMAAGDLNEQLRRRGMRPMRPDLAVGALATALTGDETTLTVADIDWERFAPGFTAARARPLIGDLPAVAALTAAEPAAEPALGGGLADRLAGLTEPDQHRLLLDLVRGHAAAVLGHDGPDAVTPDRPFRELGFDSLTAVEVRRRLNAATGTRLPTTVVFDHPTPDALARHLRTQVGGERAAAQAAGPAVAAPRDPHEPIAVVAMSCRFPGGVTSPEDLWSLLLAGRDAVGPFPDDRGWDPDRLYPADAEAEGRSRTLEGAFLADAGGFDADFFGISPREALAMDPQQRQVLELAWETFERAGIDPATARDSLTGVFVGASPQGYAGTLEQAAPEMDGYRLTGDALSVVSGRIAYTLGLRGPAVTVDTACSSALVAVNLAVQALRSGECAMALAGGAAVMVAPTAFAEFSRQGGLAPDGRCKPFADAADGVGWGEGAGLVLLERLSDARANGHQVLAVVRGSATNQDGASNGLSAPNGPAQQRVIHAALANAGLTPDEVDAVEGHGTGTRLGDPIEAQALLATYGRGRPADRPLLLGAVKSNIGHTQAASGIAGVIKMVLAMRHGVLPRTLHVDQPSRHVDWTTGAVELLADQRPWPATGRPRRAAVSAFGVSGTNGHVILEQAEAPEHAEIPEAPAAPAAEPAGAPLAWPLSARDATALRAQAARLAATLDARPELAPADVAATLATGRAALDHRAVVLGADPAQLRAGLDALAAGLDHPAVPLGTPDGGRLAVLFSGQGSQRVGMGRDLYRAHPAFADALDAVFAHLDPLLPVPLRDVVFGDDQKALDRTEFAQPALFAVEVALYRLWESWGLAPDALAGHSIGELAAAHVAGVLSLPDACAVIAARGALMQALPASGVMIAVQATEAEIAPECSEHVGIAAINGPHALVLSGRELEVLDLADRLKADGRKVTRLRVSHAFHSPLMEPMLAAFRRVLESVTFHPPTLPVVSTLTGQPATAEELGSPDYWVRHVRQPVRFADAVTALTAQGVTTALEVGPGGVLAAMGQDSAPDAVFVPTLRADRPEVETLAHAAARLHVRGARLDLAAATGGRGRRVDLPTYPFQHRRYWLTAAVAPAGGGAPAALGVATGDHPLLRAAVELPDGAGTVLTGRLAAHALPWLAGRRHLPPTGLLDLALHAAAHHGLDTVAELALRAPLSLPDRGGLALRVTVGPAADGARTVRVHSRPEDADRDDTWTEHATGTLALADATPNDTGPVGELAAWPPPGATPAEPGGGWRLAGDRYAEVAIDEPADDGFALHPALLDAALTTARPASRDRADDTSEVPLVPHHFTGARLHATGATALRVRWSPTAPDAGALTLADPAGRPVVTVAALQLRPAADQPAELHPADALFTLTWTPVAPATAGAAPAGRAVLGPDPLGLGPALDLPTLPTDPDPDAAPDHRDPGLDLDLALDHLDGVTELLAPCPRAADQASAGDPIRAALTWALTLTQRWLADERTAHTRLVLVTHGAVHPETPDPAQAAVWGLLRSAQTENPGRFVLLDLDGTPASTRALPAALATEEPQLALQEGRLTAPRLTRATAPHHRRPAGHPAPFDPDRTVLVTGGLGTLGALVARHLVTAHGVRHLALAGRRGLATEGAEQLRDELAALGAEVTVAACDLADRAAVAALLAALDRPLGAVVHAAGVVDDGVLPALTPERLDRVLGPKVDGLRHLDALTRDADLTAFVVFSSAAGVLGSAGQASYAAANVALDALVQRRRAAGRPGVSLAWGMWAAASGMTAGLDAGDRARLGRSGIRPLPTADALALLDAATHHDRPTLVPVLLDTATLRGQAADGTLPPVLRGLVRAPARRATDTGPAASETLAETLAGQPPADREQTVLNLVCAQVAAVLGHATGSQVDPGRALRDLGFDSLTSVELRNRLTTTTGLRLPTTLVFDHPSAAAISRHLLTLLPGGQPARETGLLDQLDQLEHALFDLADDGTATKVDLRLRALLARWSDTRTGGGQTPETGPDPHPGADLDEATDDELFGYLDNELETS